MARRVALVLDRDFASRERRMIARQRYALGEEGVSSIVAIPDDAPDLAEVLGDGPCVLYRPRGLPATRDRRATQLAQRIAAELGTRAGADSGGRGPLDAILACGAHALPVSVRLALQTGATLMVMPHRPEQVRHAKTALDTVRATGEALLLAPSRSYERLAVSSGISPGEVRLVPWGVPAGEAKSERLDPDLATSVVISGSGVDPKALAESIAGVAEVVRSRERVIVLIDAHAVRRAELWKQIRAERIEGETSLVPLMQGQRDLVLHADIMLIPEASGTHQSLPLDAIANGVRVVAARDTQVDWLNDERLAVLLNAPQRGDWTRAVGALVDDPMGSVRDGADARASLRSTNRASAMTAALLRAFEWAARRDSLEPRRAPAGLAP